MKHTYLNTYQLNNEFLFIILYKITKKVIFFIKLHSRKKKTITINLVYVYSSGNSSYIVKGYVLEDLLILIANFDHGFLINL